jgi:hypothetical protein
MDIRGNDPGFRDDQYEHFYFDEEEEEKYSREPDVKRGRESDIKRSYEDNSNLSFEDGNRSVPVGSQSGLVVETPETVDVKNSS